MKNYILLIILLIGILSCNGNNNPPIPVIYSVYFDYEQNTMSPALNFKVFFGQNNAELQMVGIYSVDSLYSEYPNGNFKLENILTIDTTKNWKLCVQAINMLGETSEACIENEYSNNNLIQLSIK